MLEDRLPPKNTLTKSSIQLSCLGPRIWGILRALRYAFTSAPRVHLASWGRVTGDADQGAAASKGSGSTSPCASGLHSSTKAAGSHESPTCSKLSAQERRRSAALHQNLEEGPSELSRVNDTAANQTPGCVFFVFCF